METGVAIVPTYRTTFHEFPFVPSRRTPIIRGTCFVLLSCHFAFALSMQQQVLTISHRIKFFILNFSSFFVGLFSLFDPSFLLYCGYLPRCIYSIRTVFHTIFNIYWLYIYSNRLNSELPTLLSLSIIAPAVES